MTETTKRIIALQNQAGIKDYPLETGAGIPVSSIQAWTKGKKRKDGSISETTPSADSIAKLARYFNVSADYLLCLTDEPTPLKQANIAEQPATALSTELSELSQDKQFVDCAKLYKELKQSDRREIYAYIVGLASGILGAVKVNKILGR